MDRPAPTSPVRRARLDRGASVVELALLLGVLAIASVGGLRFVGSASASSLEPASDGTTGSVGSPSRAHATGTPQYADGYDLDYVVPLSPKQVHKQATAVVVDDVWGQLYRWDAASDSGEWAAGARLVNQSALPMAATLEIRTERASGTVDTQLVRGVHVAAGGREVVERLGNALAMTVGPDDIVSVSFRVTDVMTVRSGWSLVAHAAPGDPGRAVAPAVE